MPRSPIPAAPARLRSTKSRPPWKPPRASLRHSAPKGTQGQPIVQEKLREHVQRETERKRRIPWSVRMVASCCNWAIARLEQTARVFNWIGRQYPQLHSMTYAHRYGWVSRLIYGTREKRCKECLYAYDYNGYGYCRGDNGGRGCGCGHWRGSRRTYKLRLAAFKCPIQLFGTGRAYSGWPPIPRDWMSRLIKKQRKLQELRKKGCVKNGNY